jgi:hypothetical protein
MCIRRASDGVWLCRVKPLVAVVLMAYKNNVLSDRESRSDDVQAPTTLFLSGLFARLIGIAVCFW